jgi:hypothetical protein
MSDIHDAERMIRCEFETPTLRPVSYDERLSAWAKRLTLRESELQRQAVGIENSRRIQDDSALALSEGWVLLKAEQDRLIEAQQRVRGEKITACVVVGFALLCLLALVLQMVWRFNNL